MKNNCFDYYYLDSGRWPGQPLEEKGTKMIEHSDMKSTRAILRNAPKWVVDEVQEQRKLEGMQALPFSGIPNYVGTETQVAENRKALLLKKADLLREVAEDLLD